MRARNGAFEIKARWLSVFIGNFGRYILKYHVDIFVMGDDWRGKFDDLNDICRVVYLPRTPDICSTEIKKILSKTK